MEVYFCRALGNKNLISVEKNYKFSPIIVYYLLWMFCHPSQPILDITIYFGITTYFRDHNLFWAHSWHPHQNIHHHHWWQNKNTMYAYIVTIRMWQIMWSDMSAEVWHGWQENFICDHKVIFRCDICMHICVNVTCVKIKLVCYDHRKHIGVTVLSHTCHTFSVTINQCLVMSCQKLINDRHIMSDDKLF